MSVPVLLQKMLDERQLGYPVADRSGALLGFVSLGHVQQSRAAARPEEELKVSDIMSTGINRISPEAGAMETFEQMGQSGFAPLLVVDQEDRLNGIITKTDIMRVVRLRVATGA